VYGKRFLEEVERVERGQFWGSLIFAAQAVRLARLDPIIPHICRGSAGSSLLCYLVGITNIDPVKHGISLSRFLSGGRDKPPDIDLDFPAECRAEMWARLRGRFGDRLGFVATKLRYRKRGALREALRRCSIPFEFWLASSPVISEDQRQRVMEVAQSLEGEVYGLSRHCGGIVFFPKGIPGKYLSARNKEPFSQLILDKEELEETGFGKLDVLSNYGLSHLRYMQERDAVGFEKLEDSRIGEVFSRGNTWGIIQAESPAMRKLLMTLKVSSEHALTLALGLIRPAVAVGGRTHKPAAVGRNPLERLLVYEDDVAEFLSVILGSGMSLGEYSRRILAKGGQEAKKLLSDVGRIVNKKGRDKILFRGRYWSWTEIKKQLGLASAYSFCKAHATAYGQVAWALASYKASNPSLFWEGFLNTSIRSSMYLPWVHFQRMKRELGVFVIWPGDLSLPLGKFFNFPWVLDKKYLYPVLSKENSMDSGARFGDIQSQFTFADSRYSGYDYQTMCRQLQRAGFWAGGLSRAPSASDLDIGLDTGYAKDPLYKTYIYEQGDAQYGFCGLRALKSPRLHPINKDSVCLFQTLGVKNGGLRFIESTLVFGKDSISLERALGSESHYLSSYGTGSVLWDTYYCKSF
jgi:hypothetical protein